MSVLNAQTHTQSCLRNVKVTESNVKRKAKNPTKPTKQATKQPEPKQINKQVQVQKQTKNYNTQTNKFVDLIPSTPVKAHMCTGDRQF